MNTITPVDRSQHQQLKIKTDRQFSHAAGHYFSPVTLPEVAKAANNYPLVFFKDSEDGRFRCAALFGFTPGENLFHLGGKAQNQQGWNATYVPLNISRYPFAIGQSDNGKGETISHVCFEPESPLVNDKEGEALFDLQGEDTPYYQQTKRQLAQLLDYDVMTRDFVNVLVQLNLLQPLSLEITYASGAKQELAGLYHIDEHKLRALAPEQVLALHQQGYWGPVYSCLASLNQLERLRQLNDQHGDKAIDRLKLSLGSDKAMQLRQGK